jgi:hypothetical protein
MADPDTSRYLAAALFGGIGSALTALGVGLAAAKHRFLKTATQTRGTILRYEMRSDGESETAHPVVEFRDARGIRRQATMSVGTGGVRLADPGTPVDVVYDPRNPAEASIRAFTHLWLFPLLLTAFGLVFAAVGVLMLLLG